MTEPLLRVRDLDVRFDTLHGPVHAVRGVDLDLAAGEAVALVGESGSGKTVTGRSLLGLTPENGLVSGSVRFDGTDLVGLSDRALRRLRGRDVGMVFQDALDSLNPVFSIGSQMRETLQVRGGLTRRAASDTAVELLSQVGIPDAGRRMRAYPHQFSGGMRQRVCIAMAIALRPRLLIADEPTTALDVTVQAGILELLDELRREAGMSLVFVTHDLAVARRVADRIAVMFHGRLVEQGPIDEVFDNPRHEYTRALLAAHPAHARSWRDLNPVAADLLADPVPEAEPSAAVPSPEEAVHGI